MSEVVVGVELASSLLSLGTLALGMAFTSRQRKAILNRDHNICQFPSPHECCGSKDKPKEKRILHVHHVLPQRYCQELNINPDYDENGITICKSSHTGPKGIHPDIARAHTKEDFERVFKEREEKIKNKQPYRDTSHDRQLHALAVKNTQLAKLKGWFLPPKNNKP